MATMEGDHFGDSSTCTTAVKFGLSKRQRRLCERNADLLRPIRDGASLSLEECANQFSDRRWNCSTNLDLPLFEKVLAKVTPETAYLQAISAAGISYEITRHCSTGLLSTCGCDKSVNSEPSPDFKWSGCSDNVHYGNMMSSRFTEAAEKKKSGKSLISHHNSEVGRMVLFDNMEVRCKCHGVSGSCEIKTCRKALPDFAKVGAILREKFDSSSKIKVKRTGSRKELTAANEKYKGFTSSDLIYLEESPSYCDYDPNTGSLGTVGRMCNATSQGMDGCGVMCCDRGYHTKKMIVSESCNCKFTWCCDVHCDICTRNVEENICK